MREAGARRLVVLFAILVVVLPLAACGDDDEAPTRAAYVASVNAVCENGQEAFNELFESGFPSTPDKLRPFFVKLVEIAEVQQDELRALELPDEDKAKFEDFLDTNDKALDDFRAATEDQAKAEKLFQEEGGANEQASQEEAKALGLDKCLDEENQPLERQDPATFSPEKRAYVEKADAICKAANDKAKPVEDDVFANFPPPLEKWAEGIPKLVAIFRPAYAEIRKIAPPAADKERITALLDDHDVVVAKFERAAQLAAARDQAAFDPLISEVFEGFEALDAALVEYGFQVCGPSDEEE